MSRMAWNSGSTCPSSTTGKSYPRARRQDLNSWWSSLPDLSLSKCLCEQNHVCYFKLFIHKPATRQHQFVSIEEICILSMFHIFSWDWMTFYTYLNIMENSLRASSDTPLRFLAWICCSRLCCILIPNWSSWSHCCASPTVLCSVYLKSGNKC